jgi:hypothetical protein
MGKHELTYVALCLFLFCFHSLKAQDKLLSVFHFEALTVANGLLANEIPASKDVRLSVLGFAPDRLLRTTGGMQTQE